MSKREFVLYGRYPYLGDDGPSYRVAIVLELGPMVNYAMISGESEKMAIPSNQKISSLINPAVLGELIDVLEAEVVREAMIRGGWDPKIVSDEIISV